MTPKRLKRVYVSQSSEESEDAEDIPEDEVTTSARLKVEKYIKEL